MKKISTAGARQTRDFADQKLTIGLDLGDRSCWYCVLDEAGEVLLEQKLSTTPRWHTFRHTYSCMLRQLGVDLKVQQELLRHADVRTTMNVTLRQLVNRNEQRIRALCEWC